MAHRNHHLSMEERSYTTGHDAARSSAFARLLTYVIGLSAHGAMSVESGHGGGAHPRPNAGYQHGKQSLAR